VIRTGHKGADALVPGNTLASFDAALEAGVDMIEFDVLSERPDGSGELLIAHDYGHVHGAPQLAAALDHLAAAGVPLDVDLKLPGYEARVVEELAARGLLERSLISTMYEESLRALRPLAPRIGWSVPRLRRDWTASPLTRWPVLAAGLVYRELLPARAERALREGRCDAIMANWRVITPRLVRAVAAGGGELHAWTVDDVREIERLARMGVTGVITNDPRLFAQLSAQVAAL
jgi:glycerophosphoryl diester phosphodiesterase